MNPLLLVLAFGAATAVLATLVVAILWVALIRSASDLS